MSAHEEKQNAADSGGGGGLNILQLANVYIVLVLGTQNNHTLSAVNYDSEQ